MARPSVDGLEARMQGSLEVARVDITEPAGQRVAARYAVDRIPAFVLVDAGGHVLYRQLGGRPDGDEIARRVQDPARFPVR